LGWFLVVFFTVFNTGRAGHTPPPPPPDLPGGGGQVWGGDSTLCLEIRWDIPELLYL
jgi:hypothetical protein